METKQIGEVQAEPASLKRKKALILMWLAAVVIVGLAMVPVYIGLVRSTDGKYDALYDDPEALAGPDNFAAQMSLNHHWGKTWKGSIGKLSGVYVLFSCKAEGDAWGEIDYTLEVDRGKAKLILADPEGNVTTIQECLMGETAQETVRLPLPEGTSYVKLVGAEGAALTWRVEMD